MNLRLRQNGRLAAEALHDRAHERPHSRRGDRSKSVRSRAGIDGDGL